MGEQGCAVRMQGRWRKTWGGGNNQENKAKTVVTDEKYTVFGRQIGGLTGLYANGLLCKCGERCLCNTGFRAPSKMDGALFYRAGKCYRIPGRSRSRH